TNTLPSPCPPPSPTRRSSDLPASQHPCTGYRTSVNHSSHSSLVVAGLCPPRLTTRTLPRSLPRLRPLIRPHGLPTPQLALLLARSEEHTSELQSRENLVCRLL